MHTDTVMLTVIELDCSIHSNRLQLTESIYLLKTNLVTGIKKKTQNSKTGFEFLCQKILQINQTVKSRRGHQKCHKWGVKSAQTPPCDILFYFFRLPVESPENQVTQTPLTIKRKKIFNIQNLTTDFLN